MKSDYPTIISFYTKTWEYEKYANVLRKQCDTLGLKHFIREYPDSGEWLANTRIKPTFIKAAMEELQAPVLWIDVDGAIYKKPIELTLPVTCDFMARRQRTGPKRTWHVGTLFFNYTQPCIHLVNEWAKRASSGIGGSDEALLEQIWLEGGVDSITFEELPEVYFEILHGGGSTAQPKTVIAHRLSKCESKMSMKRRKKS